MADLARRRVNVRELTNLLTSSDESAVLAGQMKRRRDLLLSGIEVYEPKPTTN